jgi:vancomycin resistance protein YoaR
VSGKGRATLRGLRPEGSSIAATIFRRDIAAPFRAILVGTVSVAAVGIALGLAFAGSPEKLAEGVHIAGVDVGGLTPAQARTLLERRFEGLRGRPVNFTADGQSFRLSPAQLGVEVDWATAVDAARRQGEGFGPVRGLRRIGTRIFGADLLPTTRVYDRALTYVLGEIAKDVARPARDAALRFQGLAPVSIPAAEGHELDREAAAEVVVRALAGLTRGPVELPLRVAAPKVTQADLDEALQDARVLVSAPVRLDLGKVRWRLKRARLVALVALPASGRTDIELAGEEAERLLDRVAARVNRRPLDASFRVNSDGSVHVVPGAYGRKLDRAATARAILEAGRSKAGRVAHVSARTLPPQRTTAEAEAMGITSTLAGYSTGYAGTADRNHNLQLAVALLDGTLVRPGGVFSLNEAVGERTVERGFRVAPVIVGAEYEEAVGGGTSQVATTVFNAAWEAGLKIAERNPHALYINRYPVGRDATVNYPNLDLKFVNDTKRWILVGGWSTSTGITIGLYGAPTGRRVESEAGPLVVRGSPPIQKIEDPELLKGKRVIEADGEPPRSVVVTRRVYLPSGKLLYDETWSTYYRGEKRIVRIGTKLPEPPPTTTTTTTTTTTETEPPPPR